jgi:hypothetical protein
MLKPEQAREALQQHQEPDWLTAWSKAADRLPATLRPLARGLLGRAEEVNSDWALARQARHRLLCRLDELLARDRLRIWEVVFPRLEQPVEAAWQLRSRLPYQSDWVRKAFRAPCHRVVTLPAADSWLEALQMAVGGFRQDITWWAAWATHREYQPANALGVLLGAAIDAGGKEGEAVFDTLCASARNEHEVGGMGRHLTRALLVASRPDGWELIEKLLLAAQRQEGLRQVILESVDEAHPDAFRRVLRLILEHDLARFSAVVRAVDTWFGFQWDSASLGVVNKAIETTLKFLDEPAARAAAVRSGDGDELYLALWAAAFEDAVAAAELAAPLVRDRKLESRFIGTHLLAQLLLTQARPSLVAALEDDDLRVALRALQGVLGIFGWDDDGEASADGDLFEHLEKLLARLPEKGTNQKPLVWPWMVLRAEPRDVLTRMTQQLGKRPPTRLIPYLPRMETWTRSSVIGLLAGQKKWDAETRTTLLALSGDSSPAVRQAAVKALEECKLTADEAESLESMLTRKANDLRRGVLGLLMRQKDPGALASADRLRASTDANQRLAGLEMLRELVAGRRAVAACRERAERYHSGRSRLSSDEERSLAALADAAEDRPMLDNALGLLDPSERTQPVPPKKRDVTPVTPAALAVIESLDQLIHEQRETPFQLKPRDAAADEWQPAVNPNEEILLGASHYAFPYPDPRLPTEEDVQFLPLADVWQQWWRQRTAVTRDKDGLELMRARARLEWDRDEGGWEKRVGAFLRWAWGGKKPDRRGRQNELRYPHLVRTILDWLLRLEPPAGAADFLLDGLETSFALLPPDEVARVVDPQQGNRYGAELNWRDQYDSPLRPWENALMRHRNLCPASWLGAHHVRLWRLLRWKDEPGPAVPRHRPDFDVLLEAHKAGGATEPDLMDHLLGPRGSDNWYGSQFNVLNRLTGRRPSDWEKELPLLRDLADRCRQRILEVELKRGDTATAASAAALSLASVWGADTLVALITALGKEPFHRAYAYGNLGKSCVLSHLVQVCYPADADTPQVFATKASATGVSEERLIALAFKAPQWVRHVEHALGWAGFAEGVWWFLAHTRDATTGQDDDAWKALVSERTALQPEDLREGAVDVAWFHRAYQAVGAKRWPALDEAAKFASHAQGHRRAQLLAQVLLGKAKKTALVAAIRQKHAREAVRALGLLPLAKGAARDTDVQGRYKVLQEYHRYARGLGAMSRAGAIHTAEVGLANLARTAGYADPLRFQWAMEAASVADLAEGAATVTAGDVQVALAIDALGQPTLSVTRKGQPLKTVPPKVRKERKVAELLERKTELARSASRIRAALEGMMCRGDTLTAAELRQLLAHPLLAPLLDRLVLVGDGVLGYPAARGKALRDHAGHLEPVKKNEVLRLAHPHDLLQSGQWHQWQHDCFGREVVQPFKQVFRELYVVTEAERRDHTLSRRYAGQQVQPRQAAALWGARGWVVSDLEGVRRTFHDAGMSAWVTFQAGYGTPAEVEGWTLEGVGFSPTDEGKPLPLDKVPPRIFSEVMRDLDLVVSVAHRGGVDPEASASTVEMRASLLRETCDLLHLENVRVQGAHVLIDGQLAQYSVHLGSGSVHRLPGGALCIIAVHAAHRGRLFLPFADDDPRTAEVVSKVLLLARDQEIQDPGILEQIRR